MDHDQTPVDDSTDDCAICMCPPTRPKKLPCGHTFCKDCIDEAFAKCQPKCPTCGYACGKITGNQPRGKMTTQVLPSSLAGYERYSTIQITYDIPDGVQDVSEYHHHHHHLSCSEQSRLIPYTSPEANKWRYTSGLT